MKKHPSYNKPRPYNDRIIQIHKQYGMDAFTDDAQFWTLGGPEHYEFYRLSKHLSFGERSYHTVDKDGMLPINQPEVVAYPHTQFMEIYRLWRNPLAISYDSTEMLTSNIRIRKVNDTSHDNKIVDLARLVRAALRDTRHDRMAVHANYMVAYPATRRHATRGPHRHHLEDNSRVFFRDDYVRWASLFTAWMTDYDVEVLDGATEIMEGSRTEMVDFHFIIAKR